MLCKRIIPCLDINGGLVVKGKRFQNIESIAPPVPLAKKYALEGADELVLYDITASHENRPIFSNVVKEVAKSIDIPFSVGGGVRNIDDFSFLLSLGADKISVNSAAVENPSLIESAAKKFGTQCVVLSMDVGFYEKEWRVFTCGGRKLTKKTCLKWVQESYERGAGEIVLNTIDTDGLKKGYALDLIESVSQLVPLPVIASGGAGRMNDFYLAFQAGAQGALAASVFHYDEIRLSGLKKFLSTQGIPIRPLSSPI